MLTQTETLFAGYDCVKLENEALALWITRSVGPRIIGLALHGGDSLLAVLPNDKADLPGGGIFSFRGGHRLWCAPEELATTYIPDDDPVTIEEVQDGLLVTQSAQMQTGIQKSLTITLPEQDARVVIDHRLHNRGSESIELAPWAITQIKPGGFAILPQVTTPVDEPGLLPNRQLVLWPYTQMNSPHITWGDRYLFIDANMQKGAFKVGFPNSIGWLAYCVGNTLFVKYAEYLPKASYYDHQSSSECYCNPRFLELETLGPRTTLEAGESVAHREKWMVYDGISLQPSEEAVGVLVDRLGLGDSAGS